MIDKKHESELVYDIDFDRYLFEIQNQRITYLDKEIYAFDDDVQGVFRHEKYYSDIASAFASRVDDILYILMEATFGSDTSPSNFEFYARARIHLANFLTSRRDLLEKHKEIIDNVKFSNHSNKDTILSK